MEDSRNRSLPFSLTPVLWHGAAEHRLGKEVCSGAPAPPTKHTMLAIAAADRAIDDVHAPSIDERQRPTAGRHVDRDRGSMTAPTTPDQFEVTTLVSVGALFHAR